MSANKRGGAGRLPVRHIALACCLSLGIGAAWADVTVYERAPSAEELQQKLLGGEKAGQKKFKTRAIVFGDAAPQEAQPAAPEVQPAPQPAPAPVAAPMQQAAVAPSAPAVAPAPAPVAAGQSMQVSENAIAFPIQFRVNSAQLLPESLPFIQSIAGLMQKDPGIRLLVEGHTDISGNYQRNLALSRERAFAVMNHLIDHFGIDPMRLMPVGKGPMEPLPGHEPTDPKNRRVQFRIIG
ncbi:MAG: OmpA family protein [Rhodocyclaceae bacterium]|nr:OmpA family protein [Rhodocyclaceae bacterium]